MPLRAAIAEHWEARELLYFFAWRDVKLRYKQTLLGGVWAILQPVLTMLIFTLVFGRLAKVPSENLPYPVFAFAGLLPWTFFANTVATSALSLVSTPDLITKVYFPRLLVPCAPVIGGLIDLALGLIPLAGLMAFYGVVPGVRLLLFVPFLALAVITALGVGFWLSALNVEYRDIRYAIPFLIQLWLFATPVAYPSTLIPAAWRTAFGLNPMAGVVEGVRWSLLGSDSAPGPMVAASAAVALLLFVTGSLYFQRVESRFADVI